MTEESKKLNLGWISYLNLYPLLYEIRENMPDFFRIIEDTPANINEKLRRNEIELAPSSSICLLKDKPVDFLPIGVVSKGEVLSVYLGFQEEHKEFEFFLRRQIESLKKSLVNKKKKILNPEDFSFEMFSFSAYEGKKKNLPPLALTKESQTSVELTKILLQSLIGQENYLEMRKDRPSKGLPIQLLIGDKALSQKSTFFSTLDLGWLWSSLTNLPFVYAVWQSTVPVCSGLKEKLKSLALYTQKKMHINPEFYIKSLSGGKIPQNLSLSSYWKHLFYDVDEDSMKGLGVFLELAKKRGHEGSFSSIKKPFLINRSL